MKKIYLLLAAFAAICSCTKKVIDENPVYDYPTASFDVRVSEKRCDFELLWELDENGNLCTRDQSDTSQTLYVTAWNTVIIETSGASSFEGCNCRSFSDAVDVQRVDDKTFLLKYSADSEKEDVRISLRAGEDSLSFFVRSKEIIPLEKIMVEAEDSIWTVCAADYKGAHKLKMYYKYSEDPSIYGDAMGYFSRTGMDYGRMRDNYVVKSKVVAFEPENTSMRNVYFVGTKGNWNAGMNCFFADTSNKLNIDISELVEMPLESKCFSFFLSDPVFFVCIYTVIQAVRQEGNETKTASKEFLCALQGSVG